MLCKPDFSPALLANTNSKPIAAAPTIIASDKAATTEAAKGTEEKCFL